MKKVLPGYYKLNEAEIGELWGNSKIIFDTNVLLGFIQHVMNIKTKYSKLLRRLEIGFGFLIR